MGYLSFLLAVFSISLFAGIFFGSGILKAFTRNPVRTSFGLVGLVLLWGGLAWGARLFAESTFVGWRVAECYALTGKWYVFGTFILFMLGVSVRQVEEKETRQLCLVMLELFVVCMVVQRTLPIYAIMHGESHRDELGHLRQSTQHTCGPVALGNLMEGWGIPAPSERELARRAGTTSEGTTVDGMIRAAEASGFEVKSCEPRTVEELQGMTLPIIVRISTTLPGLLHATTLVEFQDDKAHFIDPDYGYRVISVERFEEILTGKALELVPRT